MFCSGTPSIEPFSFTFASLLLPLFHTYISTHSRKSKFCVLTSIHYFAPPLHVCAWRGRDETCTHIHAQLLIYFTNICAMSEGSSARSKWITGLRYPSGRSMPTTRISVARIGWKPPMHPPLARSSEWYRPVVFIACQFYKEQNNCSC